VFDDEGTTLMRRTLLPLMAVGVAAAVIGGTTAAASSSGSAHSARAAKIQLKKVGHLGRVLVNGHGQTLYLFLKDRGKTSKCYGGCAAGWPPALTTGKPKASKGVSSSKLGTTRRKDGKLQVTYNGHPLYAYIGDSGPGQASGQGSTAFGGAWWAVNAKGNKVTKR
jgi:predicted lipoprotein with Yx(FWY)xxD motif